MTRFLLPVAIGMAFALLPVLTFAQYEDDTKSPEAITAACCATISVEKGTPVDWDRFKNLFLPTAEFLITYEKDGEDKLASYDMAAFLKRVRYSETGFTETVLGLDIRTFGKIAQAFQAYHARAHDDSFNKRGINAYQLIYKEGRWWIASLMWQAETDDLKLPAELLKD